MDAWFEDTFSVFTPRTPADDAVEKCTHDALVDSDWDANLTLVELINSGKFQEVAPLALRALRRKLTIRSPKTQMLALTALEMCIKNCGQRFHAMVVEKQVLSAVVLLGDRGANTEVRDKALALVEEWSTALRDLPEYPKAYWDLRNKGVQFPGLDISAMAPVTTPAATRAQASSQSRSAPIPPTATAYAVNQTAVANERVPETRPSVVVPTSVGLGESEEDQATSRAIAEVLLQNQTDERILERQEIVRPRDSRYALVVRDQNGRPLPVGVPVDVVGYQGGQPIVSPSAQPRMLYQGNAVRTVSAQPVGSRVVAPRWTVQQDAPLAGVAPVISQPMGEATTDGVTVAPTAEQVEKIKADIAVAQSSVDILSEMLANVNPEEDAMAVADEIIYDVATRCKFMRPRIAELIGVIEDESILCVACILNDDLNRTLKLYDELLDTAEASGQSDEPAAETPQTIPDATAEPSAPAPEPLNATPGPSIAIDSPRDEASEAVLFSPDEPIDDVPDLLSLVPEPSLILSARPVSQGSGAGPSGQRPPPSRNLASEHDADCGMGRLSIDNIVSAPKDV